MFITFEGIDGCGKTSQIASVKNKLENDGYTVYCFHEPGSTKISEKIRDILLSNESKNIFNETELFLFISSRIQLLKEKIYPILNNNNKKDIILCDRWNDSTIAYQCFGDNTISIDLYTKIMNEFLNLVPDITFWLSISPEESYKRKHRIDSEQLNRLDDKSLGFYEKVESGYHKIYFGCSNRVVRLDAMDDFEELNDKIYKIIKGRMNE